MPAIIFFRNCLYTSQTKCNAFIFLQYKKVATWWKLCSGRSSTVTQTKTSYLNCTCDEKGQKYRQPPGKNAVPVARLMNETPIKSSWDSGPSGNYIKLKGRCVLPYSTSIRSHILDNKKGGGLTRFLRTGHLRRLESLNDTGENRIPLADTWPTDRWPTRRHEYAASPGPDDAMESRWWLARGLNAPVYVARECPWL